MNRVIINLDRLQHNLSTINKWMRGHGSAWTVVTKVLCGHLDTMRALQMFGVQSIGDSRLENLREIKKVTPDVESWYLRMPDASSTDQVVALSDVSLNSEISIIEAINEEAARQGKTHRIVIMIELGDLREGILPGSLVDFYRQIFNLPNVEVLGIGANLGCLAGVLPSIDQFMQLILYRELLELKFGRKLPIISAGASVSLPMVLDGQMPSSINHFRIGESVFLGTNLISGGTLPGLKSDTVMLEAEIVEIKEKGLNVQGETASITPFALESNEETQPGQRGYRAIVGIGQLDTDVGGLTPENPNYHIAGASSDLTVVNIGEDPDGLKVGDTINFYLSYSAMVRLMGGKYIPASVIPSLDDLADRLKEENRATQVMPAMDEVSHS